MSIKELCLSVCHALKDCGHPEGKISGGLSKLSRFWILFWQPFSCIGLEKKRSVCGGKVLNEQEWRHSLCLGESDHRPVQPTFSIPDLSIWPSPLRPKEWTSAFCACPEPEIKEPKYSMCLLSLGCLLQLWSKKYWVSSSSIRDTLFCTSAVNCSLSWYSELMSV